MFPIRAVEDDHVDRPGVEAQQCVKLTGTNRPIGLIVLIDHAHRALLDDALDIVLTAYANLKVCCLRTARATRRDGLWPVWVPKAPLQQRRLQPTCSKRPSLLLLASLLTLEQGSHTERTFVGADAPRRSQGSSRKAAVSP